jgi:hypothetical protein
MVMASALLALEWERKIRDTADTPLQRQPLDDFEAAVMHPSASIRSCDQLGRPKQDGAGLGAFLIVQL